MTIELDENARRIFDLRYPVKDDEGNPTETPDEVVWRVAANVASTNALYVNEPNAREVGDKDAGPSVVPVDQFPYKTARRMHEWLKTHRRNGNGAAGQQWGDFPLMMRIGWSVAEQQARRYEEMLSNKDFFPNSPTWTGAGTPLGQLAACFVLPIDDDLAAGRASIFETMKVAASIQQTGGGNGFSFGRLRPNRAIVKRSMGRASGPVGFLKVYDAAFGQIAQGGSRRGANMGVLPVHHPDIEEFISAKVEEGEIANFNISVAITDEFMEAVEKDEDFELRWSLQGATDDPVDYRVSRTIRARDLYDYLIQCAWKLGDPGNLFIDRANQFNPCPTRYTLEATNPCYLADSLLLTREAGLVRIGDLANREFTVLAGDGEWRRAWAWVTGFKEGFRIFFKNGNHLDLTADHEVFVTRYTPGKRAYEEKVRVRDLRVGDKVRPMLGADWDGVEDVVESDAVVLGLIQGDGWLKGDSVYFRNHEPEVLAFLLRWADETGHVFEEVSGGRVAIRGMRSTLEKFGFHLRHNVEASDWTTAPLPERGLPSALSRQSPRIARAFLRGLFSANGNALGHHNRVCLKTTCFGMAVEVQRLLAALGYNAYITTTKAKKVEWHNGEYLGRESYGVNICGSEAYRRFQQEIGFLHDHKMQDGWEEGVYRYSVPRVTEVSDAISLGHSQVYDFNVMSNDDPTDLVHSGWVNGFRVSQCGEQWLPPYSNCCLGSINLGNFVIDGVIEWDRLAEVTVLATQFLDDVVDANQYVPEVPELEAAAMNERRIGLGFMGLADFLSKAGARYGGEDGIDLASQVTEWMRYWSMWASIERAKERGPFPWIKHSMYDPELLRDHGFGKVVAVGVPRVEFKTWEVPQPLRPHTSRWSRPELDWLTLQQSLVQNGIRNATQCTVAPTGTISNVAGCEGSGCEPRFALSYVRTVMQEGEDVKLDYLSGDFNLALEQAGVDAVERNEIAKRIKENGGSCQGVKGVPKEVQQVFVVAADVTPREHVRMQAAMQAFIDNSISKTINMPFEATVEDVAEAYRLAFDLGCKGITIYRQGSRELEVLSTGDRPQTVTEDAWPIITPLAIPSEALDSGLPARVFPVETAFGKVQVTITEHPEHAGRPFDVRLSIGKAGNDKNADVEALGRMISTATRAGVSVSWIVEQLQGIGGQSITGYGPRRVTSVADGVGKLLARLYLGAEQVPAVQFTETVTVKQADTMTVCPNCKNATVVFESGCFHCDTRLGGCGNYEACS